MAALPVEPDAADYFSASLRALPALNFGWFDAAMMKPLPDYWH